MSRILGQPAAAFRAKLYALPKGVLKEVVKACATFWDIPLPPKASVAHITKWFEDVTDRELQTGMVHVEKSNIYHFATQSVGQVINEELTQKIHIEMQLAAQAIAERHGLVPKPGGAHWYANKISIRMEYHTHDSMRQSWMEHHARYRLKEEWLGRMVRLNNQKYKIVGINPDYSKDPIMVQNREGKTFTANPFTIAMLLGAEDMKSKG